MRSIEISPHELFIPYTVQGWQHSIVYQFFAFALLFAMSFQFMRMKDFCHSIFRFDFNIHIPRLHQSVVPQQPQESVPVPLSSPKGVSFHRIITSFPENAEFLLNFDQQETYCAATDEYGANDCDFGWGTDVVGNYTSKIPQILDEGSSLHADLVLEGHIPYHLDCALCGQPCELKVPLIHFEYSLKMPPCPLDLTDHSQGFNYQLWKHSPTEGLLTVSVEGTATVFSSPGEKLADFQISGAIR